MVWRYAPVVFFQITEIIHFGLLSLLNFFELRYKLWYYNKVYREYGACECNFSIIVFD